MNALPVTKPPMRIAYLSGPTDAEAIFADLRSGAAASYFGTNYMRQFLIFADEIGAEALIATWNEGGKREHVQERFTFVNLPPAQGTGMRYYSQMLRLQLAFLSWRDLAEVSSAHAAATNFAPLERMVGPAKAGCRGSHVRRHSCSARDRDRLAICTDPGLPPSTVVRRATI